MLNRIKEALVNNDIDTAVKILSEINNERNTPDEVYSCYKLVIDDAIQKIQTGNINIQLYLTAYLDLIVSLTDEELYNLFKQKDALELLKKLKSECIEMLTMAHSAINVETLFNASNSTDTDNNNYLYLFSLTNVKNELAKLHKDKNIVSLTQLLILNYYKCLLISAKLVKPEHRSELSTLFQRYRAVLNQLQENNWQKLGTQAFDILDADGTCPACIIFIRLLLTTTLAYQHIDFYYCGAISKKESSWLTSELELEKKSMIFKKFDYKTDLIDYIIPMNLLFTEAALSSDELVATQLQEICKTPPIKEFKFNNVPENILTTYIYTISNNINLLLNNIGTETCHITLNNLFSLLENNKEYVDKKNPGLLEKMLNVKRQLNAQERARASHLLKSFNTVELFFPAIYQCVQHLPYFIQAYNNTYLRNAHTILLTTYHDALIKFALLANRQFESTYSKGGLNKSDAILHYIDFAAKHKTTIKEIVNKIVFIFNELLKTDTTNLKLDTDTHVDQLHHMIENLYSDLKYININMLDWLKIFTNDTVNIYSGVYDLTIDFKDPVHRDIFRAEFAAIFDDKHLTLAENGDVIISDFRKLELLRTKQLESKCRASLKKLQKSDNKSEENKQPQFSGEINTIYDDKPEEKTTYDKRKTRKTLTPAEIQQKLSAKKKEQKPSKVKKSATKKSATPSQANTVNNNNNISNNQHLAQQALVATQPTPVQAPPQKLEVVSFSAKEIEEPIFIRPKKEVFAQLAAPLQYQWQLDTAYNEMIEHPEVKDQLSMRYFVLYNAIRMLQASLSIAKDLDIKNTPLYKQILILRNMLADRMEYILDPNSTNEDFLSTKNSSIFMQIEKIYLRLQKIVHFDTPMMTILVESNPIHKILCSNGSDIDNVPETKAHALLTFMHEKLDQRLKLFMTKLSDANQLNAYPVMTGAVKMMLCEVGALARRLRDGHPALCGKLFNTNLTFQAYPDALVANNQNNNPRKKKDPKRLLPHLKTLNSDETHDFLKHLTLGQLLTLMIEVRNTIGHDMDDDWQDCPEEITTHLAFDLAKHILTRINEIQNVLNQITPDDKPKLQVTSQAFVPTFLRNQTTLTPLNVAAQPFQPRSNMNPNSGTFVPGNRSVTTGTLFNQNNQPPVPDNDTRDPSGQAQWENNSNNL